MRTILYTGKGGVGKTSVSAATALRCADLGLRTVVMSTDLAHSLGDALDTELGAEPLEVAPNLWAQEVDVYHELHRNWGGIQNYISQLFAWRGLNEAIAEEMTVFPGMEELSSLLLINGYAERSAYDVCIVDCAPTGETLRLLSFPEMARWWVKNIMPVQRKLASVVRPVAKRIIDVPMPGDDVYRSIEDLMDSLDKMHALLADREKSSVRLVLNPEKMVIREAQRTFTYLNLYGYSVDAVICNRVIPDNVTDEYFAAWKTIQKRHYQLVEEVFSPVPILNAPLFDEEVVGIPMLRRMADAVYGQTDPSKILFHGRAHTVVKTDTGYILSLLLPLAHKGDVEMFRSGEELVVRVGNWRRNILLPRALVTLETRGATFHDGTLDVNFAEPAAS